VIGTGGPELAGAKIIEIAARLRVAREGPDAHRGPVRRGTDERTCLGRESHGSLHQIIGLGDVFDDFTQDDHIEGAISERGLVSIRRNPSHQISIVLPIRVSKEARAQVDADAPEPLLSEENREIA
jgi:hypothetical protein